MSRLGTKLFFTLALMGLLAVLGLLATLAAVPAVSADDVHPDCRVINLSVQPAADLPNGDSAVVIQWSLKEPCRGTDTKHQKVKVHNGHRFIPFIHAEHPASPWSTKAIEQEIAGGDRRVFLSIPGRTDDWGIYGDDSDGVYTYLTQFSVHIYPDVIYPPYMPPEPPEQPCPVHDLGMDYITKKDGQTVLLDYIRIAWLPNTDDDCGIPDRYRIWMKDGNDKLIGKKHDFASRAFNPSAGITLHKPHSITTYKIVIVAINESGRSEKAKLHIQEAAGNNVQQVNDPQSVRECQALVHRVSASIKGELVQGTSIGNAKNVNGRWHRITGWNPETTEDVDDRIYRAWDGRLEVLRTHVQPSKQARVAPDDLLGTDVLYWNSNPHYDPEHSHFQRPTRWCIARHGG